MRLGLAKRKSVSALLGNNSQVQESSAKWKKIQQNHHGLESIAIRMFARKTIGRALLEHEISPPVGDQTRLTQSNEKVTHGTPIVGRNTSLNQMGFGGSSCESKGCGKRLYNRRENGQAHSIWQQPFNNRKVSKHKKSSIKRGKLHSNKVFPENTTTDFLL